MLCAFVFALAACGKKGDPTPPVPVIPQATTDLVVTQRGENVTLAWSFPTLTAAGTKLPQIGRVTVYRYSESLPATELGRSAPLSDPGQIDPNRPVETQLFARLPLMPDPQFAKVKEPIASLEKDSIPAYVVGARIVFEDRPAIRTADDRPVRLYYSVSTDSGEAESALSNVVSIVPLVPPGTPRSLHIAASARAVDLQWEAPADSENARPSGYNVYRFAPTGPIVELGKPINAAPVSDTRFSDSPSYGAHRYAVTAVRDAGPPQVESEPTQTMYVEFRDLVAPPGPGGVTALREATAVRLVWDAIESSDFKGYRIYRTPQGGQKQLLNPELTTETTFRDERPELGVTYVYSVSSVDESGNESAAAPAEAILLPR
jgi:hypothetical protein